MNKYTHNYVYLYLCIFKDHVQPKYNNKNRGKNVQEMQFTTWLFCQYFSSFLQNIIE